MSLDNDLPKLTDMLLILHNEGHLDELYKLHKNIINQSIQYHSGTQVATFMDNDKKEIYKLCSKRIRYFGNFLTNNATDFQKTINNLDHKFFVPIKQIIYENPHVFIYSQPFCSNSTSILIEPYSALCQLLCLVYMIKQNKIVNDIGYHNIGLYQDHQSRFDYHGMWHLNIDENGVIQNDSAWSIQILKNFDKFFNQKALFEKQYFDKLTSILHQDRPKQTSIIKQLIKLYMTIYKAYKNKISYKDRHKLREKLKIVTN